jgi:homoserine O-succinyltransferase/O-acetyltransferase
LTLRIAVLDMYDGSANEGMRCIKKICTNFLEKEGIEGNYQIFNVRQKCEIPKLNDFDLFISTGGPGNPLKEGYEWETKYDNFLDEILNFNKTSHHKKVLFLICHSFQIAVNHWQFGKVCKRKTTSFGVMPIHRTEDGLSEPFFKNLPEIFYSVDSRDYQVIKPNYHNINQFEAKILCIEKERPHINLERAVMAIRFSNEIIGVQFHIEADSEGMLHYFKQEEKKKAIVKEHGLEKYNDMIAHLDDPDKILLTESEVLPAFLRQAVEEVLEVV